ncbi:putative secreted lipase [Phaeomoniella chlamydospora]|uniref:Putative secreted lipase n=1 Tax=Phaeomoniella chlamydospora TaxID=158046 RepID=A0A0G2EAE0_PHACM|nr:putative secreted lipase [Phaeomoniella chlamydospora]
MPFMHFPHTTALILALISQAPVSSLPTSASPLPRDTITHNDYSCRSTTHPNPVVILHGLGATYYEDLNYLEAYLQTQDYCTFSLTYGAYDGFPFVGGLKPINESAAEIASFITDVYSQTGSENKINIVGHSEGAFQSLYVPKFETGVSAIVDKIVAIAPPTHGTSFAGLYNLAYIFGNTSRELVGDALDALGCPACDDLGPDGTAVEKLNDGTPIVQDGNTVTILTSKYDELVTPTTTAFVYEDGVTNEYVQDTWILMPCIAPPLEKDGWDYAEGNDESSDDDDATAAVNPNIGEHLRKPVLRLMAISRGENLYLVLWPIIGVGIAMIWDWIQPQGGVSLKADSFDEP